ncbi:terpenoid synthase [Lentinula raphanica]|uniref:Terpene synthase n=1 Tax=Lentinula raphanica TaxID=153919 RepID=A0AA38UDY1_9AGAR|nr:terpenoid synthase [Lentinula raphanica]KAJ3837600.1 terpenoid synthase [Lentinula raphanica]KAJ3976658.1 terpenoid synthase [Lentinula raphanica]
MGVSQLFVLPDTLRSWPWNRKLNPNYEKVKAESKAWLESFHAFPPKAQNAFNRCDFNLLASLAYPNASAEHLRTGCDLMNLFFVFDEYTDICDAQEARRLADIVMDALRNSDSPRPQDESVVGEIARQFWHLAKETSTESAQNIFIETFDHYTTSVVEQAEDRVTHHIRDVESYLRVRRDTIGAKPSFALLHLSSELPEGFLSDPLVEYISTLTIDMLIIGNDICSYNVEQARGDDGHNMVTIVMNSMCLSLDEALLWISEFHDILAELFHETYMVIRRELPALETSDAAVLYLEGLGNWVRANDCWSFESERYFAQKGTMIQKSRMVELLPRIQ